MAWSMPASQSYSPMNNLGYINRTITEYTCRGRIEIPLINKSNRCPTGIFDNIYHSTILPN